MRNFMFKAACAAAISGAIGLTARAALVDDWQMLYEADLTPESANSVYLTRQSTVAPVTQFAQGSSAGTAGVTDLGGGNNGFAYSTLGTDGANYYTLSNSQTGYAPNSTTGYTFETRAQVVGLSVSGPTAAAHFDFDEATSGVDKFWKLVLYRTGEGQYKALLAGLDPDAGNVTVDIDNTSFHTYRVTVLGTVASLYVDGSLRGTMSNFTEIGTNAIRFGDLTNADGSVVVDYIRVNDTGAIPIPEPMALSLLGLGGLMLWRCRT